MPRREIKRQVQEQRNERYTLMQAAQARGFNRIRIARALYKCARCAGVKCPWDGDRRFQEHGEKLGPYVVCYACMEEIRALGKRKNPDPGWAAPWEQRLVWMLCIDLLQRSTQTTRSRIWAERDKPLADREAIVARIESLHYLEDLIGYARWPPDDLRSEPRYQAVQRESTPRMLDHWLEEWRFKLWERARESRLRIEQSRAYAAYELDERESKETPPAA